MYDLRFNIVQLAMTAMCLTFTQFNDTEYKAPYFHTGDYSYMRKLVVLVD